MPPKTTNSTNETSAATNAHGRFRWTFYHVAMAFAFGAALSALVFTLTPLADPLPQITSYDSQGDPWEATVTDKLREARKPKAPRRQAQATPAAQQDPMAELRRIQEINERNRRMMNPTGPTTPAHTPQTPGLPQPPTPHAPPTIP